MHAAALLVLAQVAVAEPQPVWLTLALALGPWLIGALVALHPLLKLGAWLHADAQKRSGVGAKAEDEAATFASQLDAFLESNQQSAKDLLDPAKRAAAEAHLAEAGNAAVAAALKEAL